MDREIQRTKQVLKRRLNGERDGSIIDLIQTTDLVPAKPKFSGVRKSQIVKELPSELAIERNIIKVPICVAHAKAARQKEFIYSFPERELDGERFIPQLIIKSAAGTPLPLQQHAKVLDALLAILAYNFNEDGEVRFSYSDLARLLAIPNTNNQSIKEAIKRYHFNPIFFNKCWVNDPMRFTSWTAALIKKTDLFESRTDSKNPRNSRKKENLHYVMFAPEIVESVKSNFIRLFPKEAFSELDAGTYTLYKLFYAPTDREPVRRTLDFVARFLGWGDRVDRLRPWIVKHLQILQQKEFILWWQKKDDCFEVCSNVARFKRHIAEMRRLDPMKAERTKAKTLLETRKQAKLQGAKVEIQTQQAVLNLQTNLKDKTKDDFEKVFELRQGENILEQFSEMSPEEREVFIKMIRKLPVQDRDCFISSKLDNFFES